MKKVITGLLVLLCISALTGCGKDDVTLTNEDNGGTISSSGIQKPSQTQSAITGHNNTIQTTKASGNSANASADLLTGLPTALGFNVIHFQPFASGSTWLDFWDFLVSYLILPLGSLALVIFCTWKCGWGYENFMKEANAGKGIKIPSCMKYIYCYILPVFIIFIFVYGMITFPWH